MFSSSWSLNPRVTRCRDLDTRPTRPTRTVQTVSGKIESPDAGYRRGFRDIHFACAIPSQQLDARRTRAGRTETGPRGGTGLARLKINTIERMINSNDPIWLTRIASSRFGAEDFASTSPGGRTGISCAIVAAISAVSISRCFAYHDRAFFTGRARVRASPTHPITRS